MAETSQAYRLSENDENAVARNRGKAAPLNATSRPALGTITNKGGRVQPGRAAKVGWERGRRVLSAFLD